MKKWIAVYLVLISWMAFGSVVEAHHYKGLPHYGYFENYPETPTLEFSERIGNHEVKLTVYNFQGLNLEKVDAPDDVRFFIAIVDLENAKTYAGNASFRLMQKDKIIFDVPDLPSEQENIFVINREITEQGKLDFFVAFNAPTGERIEGMMNITLSENFLSKYGVVGGVGIFFAVVIGLRVVLRKQYHPKRSKLR